MTESRQQQAQDLHNEGAALADAGDREGALAKYMTALALDMQRSDTLYNVGLYNKYRDAWAESFRFNNRSVEIDPTEQAANWNLAIAATAMRKTGLAMCARSAKPAAKVGRTNPTTTTVGRCPCARSDVSVWRCAPRSKCSGGWKNGWGRGAR
jgi:tetratricopeptide (TPR) repeat protein